MSLCVLQGGCGTMTVSSLIGNIMEVSFYTVIYQPRNVFYSDILLDFFLCSPLSLCCQFLHMVTLSHPLKHLFQCFFFFFSVRPFNLHCRSLSPSALYNTLTSFAHACTQRTLKPLSCLLSSNLRSALFCVSSCDMRVVYLDCK